MELKGIDVSKYQNNINWYEVKENGIDFALLRCGYTGYGEGKRQATDNCFEKHYQDAKMAGMPVGVYFFSRAVIEEEGIKEAQFVLSLLQGKQLEYPVYIDVEDTYYQAKTDKHTLTNAVKAFCNVIEKAGYYVGVYACKDWFLNRLNLSELTDYDKWVAQYNSKCTLNEPHGIWQYSSTGKVSGIANNVDLDYGYKDYPQIIKSSGLNGFGKMPIQQPVQPTPPLQSNITVGSIVKVKQGAKTYDNKSIASFIFGNSYRVDELKGSRAVLDLKGICTPVNVNDLYLLNSKSPCPYAEPNINLRMGSKGEYVKWVQWHLIQLNWHSVGNIDGMFGVKTDNAVRKFQTKHNLKSDGIVGVRTRAMLKEVFKR